MEDGNCLETCRSDKYPVPEDNECVPCDTTCASCDGTRSITILTQVGGIVTVRTISTLIHAGCNFEIIVDTTQTVVRIRTIALSTRRITSVALGVGIIGKGIAGACKHTAVFIQVPSGTRQTV